jgi:hypothetical protein
MCTIRAVHVAQVLAQVLHGSILVGLDVEADAEVVVEGQAEEGWQQAIRLGAVFVS